MASEPPPSREKLGKHMKVTGDSTESAGVHDFEFTIEPKHNLNEVQIAAVKSIIHGVNCPNKHTDIILGPSGSGKTRTVASTLLTLGNDKRALVCVPTVSSAKELVDMVEELGGMILRRESFGKILVLAEQSRTPKQTLQLNVDSLATVYNGAFLFWRPFVNETIKSLESYNMQYQYQLKKCESLTFADFFKTNFTSAAKAMTTCFNFIQRLPLGTYTGIDANDITRLLNHLGDVKASLKKKDIDNEALSFVLGISSPPETASLYYQGVGAATDLKEKMNLCLETLKAIKSSLNLKEFQTKDKIKEYLVSKSKTVICTASSFSEMVSIFSQLNQSTPHAIDLLIIDDASMIPSSDLQTTLCLPGLKLQQMDVAKYQEETIEGASR